MSNHIGAEVSDAHHLVLLFARWTLTRKSGLATLTLSHAFLSVFSCAFLSVLRSVRLYVRYICPGLSWRLKAIRLRYEHLIPRCRTLVPTAQYGMLRFSSLPACMEGKTYQAACQHMVSHATNCEGPLQRLRKTVKDSTSQRLGTSPHQRPQCSLPVRLHTPRHQRRPCHPSLQEGQPA